MHTICDIHVKWQSQILFCRMHLIFSQSQWSYPPPHISFTYQNHQFIQTSVSLYWVIGLAIYLSLGATNHNSLGLGLNILCRMWKELYTQKRNLVTFIPFIQQASLTLFVNSIHPLPFTPSIQLSTHNSPQSFPHVFIYIYHIHTASLTFYLNSIHPLPFTLSIQLSTHNSLHSFPHAFI